jgi:hypothetical protein
MDMNIVNENNKKAYIQQNKIKTINTNYLSYAAGIQKQYKRVTQKI